MREIIKIQGYKCPYCGCEGTNEKEMLEHMSHCRKNNEYVQKCINCRYLERDWLVRKLYDEKSICCYSKEKCPYINHDDAEINTRIEAHEAEMKQYGY